MDDDDPRAQAHDIYQWVGYLQETLVDALTRLTRAAHIVGEAGLRPGAAYA